MENSISVLFMGFEGSETFGIYKEMIRGKNLFLFDTSLYNYSASKKNLICSFFQFDEPSQIEWKEFCHVRDVIVVVTDSKQTNFRRLINLLKLVFEIGFFNVILLVNNMEQEDVGYSEEVFDGISDQVMKCFENDELDEEVKLFVIPASGLKGDNIVEKSKNMEWWSDQKVPEYGGMSLVGVIDEICESVVKHVCFKLGKPLRMKMNRFYSTEEYHNGKPVWTPSGTLLSGSLEVGMRVTAFPSNKTSIVKGLEYNSVKMEKISSDLSMIRLTLTDTKVVGEFGSDQIVGDVHNHPPLGTRRFTSVFLCSKGYTVQKGKDYRVNLAGFSSKCRVSKINFFDPNTLDEIEGGKELKNISEEDVYFGIVEIETYDHNISFEKFREFPPLGIFHLRKLKSEIDDISHVPSISRGMRRGMLEPMIGHGIVIDVEKIQPDEGLEEMKERLKYVVNEMMLKALIDDKTVFKKFVFLAKEQNWIIPSTFLL